MSDTQAVSTLTVANNWLDTTTVAVQNAGGNVSSGFYYSSTWYPYIVPQYSYGITYTHPRIRLTLTEVEHLRKAAGKDKALRATLQKFTPYIEIEVDF